MTQGIIRVYSVEVYPCEEQRGRFRYKIVPSDGGAPHSYSKTSSPTEEMARTMGQAEADALNYAVKQRILAEKAR